MPRTGNGDAIEELSAVADALAEHEISQAAPKLAHIRRLGFDAGNRRIYLGEIEERTGTLVQQMIHQLNFETTETVQGIDGSIRSIGIGPANPTPIELWLNTPGGDVVSMFAIHDAIRASRAPVHVHGYGQVCSAGVLILACGHRRFVSESCCLMSHENKFYGAEELGHRASRDRRDFDDWLHTQWCELMGRYTPNDAKWWRAKTEKKAEYWLLGGAAIVAAGLADEVEK